MNSEHGTKPATGVATEVATLGGGCFWCLEAAFVQLIGVESVVSGYAGGRMPNPDYRSVCGGDTGHAEVVEVRFDPAVIDYRTLLQAFFAIHDPTTPNRQGNDVGTQYRSVIFYHSQKQKEIAAKYTSDLDASGTFASRIVTTIEPFEVFYPAEDYHQNYYNLTGDRNPYCTYVITPKVQKFRKQFKEKLKE